MKKLLALETSTEACSVALSFDQNKHSRFKIASRQHAELILPMIDSILTEAECTLKEIDAIAFGQGPGSFMGVRIATAISQSIGFAIKKPLIPISSLRSLAQQAYQMTLIPHIIAGWDARMGEIYWGVFHVNNNSQMELVDKEYLDSPKGLSVKLTELPNSHYLGVGNAWQAYQKEIGDLPDSIKVSQEIFYPMATTVAELASTLFEQDKTVSPFKVEPCYIRNQVTHVSSVKKDSEE